MVRALGCFVAVLIAVLTLLAGIAQPEENPHAEALVNAADNGDIKTVEKLLQQGVKVDSQDEEGWTALMAASARGHVAMVRLLLRKGANPHVKNIDGWTALWIAGKQNQKEIVDILKSHMGLK